MAAKLLPLLLLAVPSHTQTVTITRDIPSSGHACIEDCLHNPYGAGTDLGDALECGAPYEEDCYCPTAAPAATIVSRHINDCASESCSRGDLTKDIESMRYYYAGYCVPNGYTADLVEAWYGSAEVQETGGTSEGESSVTSTSVATTTATSTATRTTTEEEDEETSTTSTEASTSEETEQAATSTRLSVVTETASGDGRNPDGLPDLDFEGNDPEDAANLSRGGMLLLGVVPVIAFWQWM